MKTILVIMGVFLLLAGCSTNTKNSFELPQSINETNESPNRQIAADQIDQRYNIYFSEGNYFIKLKKVADVAKHLHSIMPEKASAKKRLVAQFSRDVSQAVALLAVDKISTNERYTTWVPMLPNQRMEKVQILGKVVQSFKVMSRMGIYLTSSGVIDPDSVSEDYYHTFLEKAVSQIDEGSRGLTLIYSIEKREEHENEAKLNYAKTLALDSRSVLRRSFQTINRLDIKRIDKVLKQIHTAQNIQQTKVIIDSADYKFVLSSIKLLHIVNSSDITGFEDEVDMTLRTKFSLEMINYLLTSVR